MKLNQRPGQSQVYGRFPPVSQEQGHHPFAVLQKNVEYKILRGKAVLSVNRMWVNKPFELRIEGLGAFQSHDV